MSEANPLNDESERTRLTSAELRKFPGYENVTDEQAEEIIDFLVELATITIEHLNLNS